MLLRQKARIITFLDYLMYAMKCKISEAEVILESISVSFLRPRQYFLILDSYKHNLCTSPYL